MRMLSISALLLSAVAGCGPSVIGRPCDSTDPCPTHFACATAHDGVNRCMRECAISGPMAETVCSDGTICLPLGGSDLGGACYLGGNVAVGSACSTDLDCTRTALCLHQGSVAECRVGCNLDGTHGCNGGFFCQPTAGLIAGFCASM